MRAPFGQNFGVAALTAPGGRSYCDTRLDELAAVHVAPWQAESPALPYGFSDAV